MAAKIQQRNEVVNQQCVELQAKLAADGIRSCVLKGQGVAQLYGSLAGLRQSGDIHLWLDFDREGLIKYTAEKDIPLEHIGLKHASASIYDDTEVEMHYIPSVLYNPIASHRLNKWLRQQADMQLRLGEELINTPSADFNMVFLLIHAYRHHLDEGIGLRQLMDYFFVLRASDSDCKTSCLRVLESLHLICFASGVMWVMQSVFGIEDKYLLCKPNAKVGSFILSEVMLGGNFGHHDERIKDVGSSSRTRYLSICNTECIC